jgi:hypothetical protein
MGEVVQFSKTGKAPREMVWVCPACGRMSMHRHGQNHPELWNGGIPEVDNGWSDRCDVAAVLIHVDMVLMNSRTGRCIGLTGDADEKWRTIQELHRQICRQKGESIFHP